MHRTICDVQMRRERSMPKNIAHVRIPKIVLFEESDNRIIYMTEWIPGTIAKNTSKTAAQQAFFQSCDFLQYVFRNLHKKELERLTKRSTLQLLTAFPFYLVLSLIRNRDIIPELLRAASIVFRNSPVFLMSRQYSLTHRDLHFENILIHHKYVYLIDFQFSCVSPHITDYVYTLRYCWDKSYLKNNLYTEIQRSRLQNNTDVQNFKTLLLMHAVQGLTARNFTSRTMKHIKQYLQFGLSI